VEHVRLQWAEKGVDRRDLVNCSLVTGYKLRYRSSVHVNR
jgi:hypothetical protein